MPDCGMSVILFSVHSNANLNEIADANRPKIPLVTVSYQGCR